MKIIAGAILVLTASVLFQTRVDLAGKKIGYDERMGLIRICQVGSITTGVGGVVLIGLGLLGRRKESEEIQEVPDFKSSDV